MPTRCSLAELNALNADAFTAALGAIYEHSPWVAQAAWQARPFASLDDLHVAMQAVVLAAPAEQQLALVCAHPELLGKLNAAELTEASRGEQASAGLDRCTGEQRDRMQALNQAYRDRFGFPFVVAVRGLNWADIIARVDERLGHHRNQEISIALGEIGRIARLRLGDALRD